MSTYTELQFADAHSQNLIEFLPVTVTGEVVESPTTEEAESSSDLSEATTRVYITDENGKIGEKVRAAEPIVAGNNDPRYRTRRVELTGRTELIVMMERRKQMVTL